MIDPEKQDARRYGAGEPAAEDERERSIAGRGSPAADEEGVLTLVCFKCGTEYYFSEEGPSTSMTCEKCGNTVFRSFFSPEPSEVTEDFRESTERDLRPDDPEGDVLPGDLLELNPDR